MYSCAVDANVNLCLHFQAKKDRICVLSLDKGHSKVFPLSEGVSVLTHGLIKDSFHIRMLFVRMINSFQCNRQNINIAAMRLKTHKKEAVPYLLHIC